MAVGKIEERAGVSFYNLQTFMDIDDQEEVQP